MKSNSVLIIIPHLGIGGTETQTLALASSLKKMGYDVSVLCLFRHIQEMIERFNRIGVRTIISSPELNRYGIEINYPKGVELLKFLKIELKKALKISRPDVIHVQYMTPATSVIILLKYYFRKKNILATAHTAADIYSPRGLKLVRWISRHCLRGFQCITERAERSFFGTSQVLSRDYKWKPKGNHFTIYNNLPSHISISKTSREFNPKQITIGVVSRLAEIKGMDLVIPAFDALLKGNVGMGTSQAPELRLLIVGGGPQRELMERQASDSPYRQMIEFVGFQPQDKLQGYYDQIDILLMPSRSEGFGLTAVEGMARGCVPVVAETGGLPEVVRDGIDGLLHKPESVEDMAATISSLLPKEGDTTILERYSEAARRRANDFSTAVYTRQIEEMYSHL